MAGKTKKELQEVILFMERKIHELEEAYRKKYEYAERVKEQIQGLQVEVCGLERDKALQNALVGELSLELAKEKARNE